jgi:polynucleotide 5'-hydroxyl-kinase GRC3/NOL9
MSWKRKRRSRVRLQKLELKKKDVVGLEGLLRIQVKSGKVSVSGALREKGDEILIPRAKSLPLEAETDALLEYTTGEGGHIERLSERTISSEWDVFLQEIVEEKPRVVEVLGGMDAGKTFFTTYIANLLLKHGIRPAVVDSDVGQSDIGPPGTVGVGVLDQRISFLYEVPARLTYFVGSMSPSGHMLEFVIGIKKMVEYGLKNADVVLVDTPGWVDGGPGRTLQLCNTELLDPDLVVALQREDELEHLLKGISVKIRRVPASKKVRRRTREERRFLREMILAKYFENAKKLTLDLRKVKLERCYFSTGMPLDLKSLGVRGPIVHAERMPEGLLVITTDSLGADVLQTLESEFGSVKVIERGSEVNTLVALIDGARNPLGIGIVDEINYTNRKLRVVTPIRDGTKAAAVQFGSIKVSPKGEEIGAIRLGSF